MTLVSSLSVELTGSLHHYDDDGSENGLTLFLFVTGVGEFQDTLFKINKREKFVVVRLRPHKQ